LDRASISFGLALSPPSISTSVSSDFMVSCKCLKIILTSLYLVQGLAWWDWPLTWSTDQLLSFSALTLLVIIIIIIIITSLLRVDRTQPNNQYTRDIKYAYEIHSLIYVRLGHLTRKIVSVMIYNVFGGTLNHTQLNSCMVRQYFVICQTLTTM